MTSLFNNKRVIQIRPFPLSNSEEEEKPTGEKEAKAEHLIQQAEDKVIEAQTKAEDILQQARQTVEQEKREWSKEKAHLRKQAEGEGFSAGFNQGEEQGFQTFHDKISEANQLLELARQDYLAKISATEEAILDIAVECAEKILNKELEQDKSSLFNVIKKAVEEVQEQPVISVFVHPEIYPLIHSQKSELEAITDCHAALQIIIKDTVEKNGCIIESPFGQINAGIESQLQELREKLFQLAQEERADE